MTLETIKATIISETDQNGVREEAIHVEELGTDYISPEIPAFRLIVGTEYVLACKQRMSVLHEVRGQFIGLVTMPDQRPVTQWYLADGTAERDLDKFPEQDPFDVVKIYKEPHTVYLLRDNMTGEYRSNNCAFTRDAAVKLALEHKLQVIAFKEIQDE